VAYLLDVNALIALHDIAHPENATVFDWFDRVRDGPWASCPITQNGFVRIVSQPSYTAPVPLSLAVDLLRDTIGGTDHELWPDDISLLDGQLFRPKHLIGHRQITDAYLLALAVKRGGRLVTFDDGVPVDAVVGATTGHVVTL
jgi:toxin-antitoxin system PIN domain toxin